MSFLHTRAENRRRQSDPDSGRERRQTAGPVALANAAETAEPPALEVGQRLSLVCDDRMLAGVLRADVPDAEILLDRPVHGRMPSSAVVQYMSPLGVVQTRISIGGPGTERGRCFTYTRVGSPQLLLSRANVRAPLSVPVIVLCADRSVIETSTLNMSASGLLVANAGRLEVEEEIELKIHLDLSAPAVTALARVMRVADGDAGVHFTQISRQVVDLIDWEIFRHLRSKQAADRA